MWAKKIPGSLCSPIASPQTNFLDETLPDVMEGAFVPSQPISENTSPLCSKFSLAIEGLPMHLDSCRDFKRGRPKGHEATVTKGQTEAF